MYLYWVKSNSIHQNLDINLSRVVDLNIPALYDALGNNLN
jgi:hypothetical protein